MRLFGHIFQGIAMAGGLLLGGCVTNGDFGRVRPELVNDGIHDWVGRDAVRNVGMHTSDYPLTDDERTLRDLAYPLIEPPFDRHRWDSVWREYGLGRPLPAEMRHVDRGAYWAKLSDKYRRSEASAYAQLVTDARNDVVRIDPFFAIAGRVLDLDGKRAQSLAHVSDLRPAEQTNALNRNNENSAIVNWVCRALHLRASSYRFALERLVVAAPSASAVEVERSLNLLAARTEQNCRGGTKSRVVSRN